MKKSFTLFSIYSLGRNTEVSIHSMKKKFRPHIPSRVYCRFQDLVVASIIYLSFVLATPEPAHAYIDPGAGSALVALIAAGFTGLVVTLRMWRSRFLSWRDKQKSTEEKQGDQPNQSESEKNDS